MNFTIKNEEIEEINGGVYPHFPKYTSQLINWANQNAQGTRSKVVGQMSDLFPEYLGSTQNVAIEDWESWYLERYPDAINNATEKIYEQVENLKRAIQLISKDLIRDWVYDLVITKTFNGLYVQKTILAKLAEKKGLSYRLATPQEESKGIDGFVGNTPYSIKADTYKVMNRLSEIIEVKMICYTKTKTGLKVEVET